MISFWKPPAFLRIKIFLLQIIFFLSSSTILSFLASTSLSSSSYPPKVSFFPLSFNFKVYISSHVLPFSNCSKPFRFSKPSFSSSTSLTSEPHSWQRNNILEVSFCFSLAKLEDMMGTHSTCCPTLSTAPSWCPACLPGAVWVPAGPDGGSQGSAHSSFSSTRKDRNSGSSSVWA